MQHELARLAAEHRVHQHGRLRRVPIVQIVWGELVVPLQLSGNRFERYHRSCVEIVALALIAVIVGAGIAGRPIEQLGLRIVGAREPGGPAPVLDGPPDPRFRPRLAARGNRPEPPRPFAGRSFVSVQESADPLVSARNPGNHQVVDH